MGIRTKRVYDPPARIDGMRILVDRVWPRGVSKEKAHIDEWLREIAPSDRLRKWFGHKPERWMEFRRKYREELREPSGAELLKRLRSLARGRTVTLVYSARDTQHNQATALAEFLKKAGR